ncbi:MAG: hypothetical protein WAN58_09540 [Anaerolineales bacterium]
MAVEAIYFIYDDNIEFSIARILKEFFKSGTVASLFSRDTCILVDVDQLPSLLSDIFRYTVFLRIKTITVNLLAHRNASISNGS